MTNPTTNFGWQMPTATDLVTDLPADFEVFGQAVDTDFVDLLGGANGYILSKASAADLDFTWIANDQGDITGITATSPLTGGGSSGAITVGIQDATTSVKGSVQLSDSTSTTSSVLASTPTATKSAYDLASAAIPKSTVTTAGDVIYATGSSAVTRLGVGTDGDVLTVAAGVPSWAAPASGGKVLQVIYGSTTTSTTNATSTYADTTLTATITPTLATSKVLVMVAQNGLEKGGANSNNAMGIKIFRGATEISASTPLMLYTGAAAETIGTSYAQNILDEPATTAATTYKTQFRNANNGSGIVVQYDNALSTIVLMEIGA